MGPLDLGWELLSPDLVLEGARDRPRSSHPPSADMAGLSLRDHDGSSGASDQDTLAPLPHPGAAPWPMAFPYQYPPPPHPYNPHPGFPELGYSYGGGSASSQHSEGKAERTAYGATGEPRSSSASSECPPPCLCLSLQAAEAVAPTVAAVTDGRRKTQRLGTQSRVAAAANRTTQPAAACGGRGSGHPASALGLLPASIATAATTHWPAACAATTRTQATAPLACPLSTVPPC